MNVWFIKEEQGIAQTWLLFPKAAADFTKNVAFADCRPLIEGRPAGIRIDCRSVANNQEGSIRSRRHHCFHRRPRTCARKGPQIAFVSETALSTSASCHGPGEDTIQRPVGTFVGAPRGPAPAQFARRLRGPSTFFG